jgi:UDP-2-acetamido-2,6-beta-L-arabino-hexul-4-ose reductase
MNILVTGANGFIGKNLTLVLGESKAHAVAALSRKTSDDELRTALKKSGVIVHLAGVNRPEVESEFSDVNFGYTEKIIRLLEELAHPIHWVFASSTQATQDNPYGRSKLQAEEIITQYCKKNATHCTIFRLPGVFGKWCRPDYNSVVATFCHNIAGNLPISIRDADYELTLVFIDDVVQAFIRACELQSGITFGHVESVYTVTLGKLAELLYAFRDNRKDLAIHSTGEGFVRALYSTYISYYRKENLAYELPVYSDSRGIFVEFLKTGKSGQFSYLTAHPGETRGAHYHHTKTEKFLIVKGTGRFRFRHLITGERFDIVSSGARPEVIDTIPGWVHDITNVGAEVLIVLLWANEVFDRSKPDTYPQNV